MIIDHLAQVQEPNQLQDGLRSILPRPQGQGNFSRSIAKADAMLTLCARPCWLEITEAIFLCLLWRNLPCCFQMQKKNRLPCHRVSQMRVSMYECGDTGTTYIPCTFAEPVKAPFHSPQQSLPLRTNRT